jgi:hypothetical protein
LDIIYEFYKGKIGEEYAFPEIIHYVLSLFKILITLTGFDEIFSLSNNQ